MDEEKRLHFLPAYIDLFFFPKGVRAIKLFLIHFSIIAMYLTTPSKTDYLKDEKLNLSI